MADETIKWSVITGHPPLFAAPCLYISLSYDIMGTKHVLQSFRLFEMVFLDIGNY